MCLPQHTKKTAHSSDSCSAAHLELEDLTGHQRAPTEDLNSDLISSTEKCSSPLGARQPKLCCTTEFGPDIQQLIGLSSTFLSLSPLIDITV